MELVLYWRIVMKRIWIILALLAVVLASYVLLSSESAPVYSASMRFVIGIRPEDGASQYYTYDRHYTWLTAEYLVDDLAEVVKSQAFARDVAATSGLNVPAGAIQGATSAGKLHRILSVQITWHDPAELERIAGATMEVLRDRNATYMAQLGTENATVSLIDPPNVGVIGVSLRQRLDLPLRLMLALAAGVALTFLLDYLDDTVRGEADLQAMAVPVLAQIPNRRRSFTLARRRRPVP
jgi:capsular polysaccharide biosynthesis protein